MLLTEESLLLLALKPGEIPLPQGGIGMTPKRTFSATLGAGCGFSHRASSPVLFPASHRDFHFRKHFTRDASCTSRRCETLVPARDSHTPPDIACWQDSRCARKS